MYFLLRVVSMVSVENITRKSSAFPVPAINNNSSAVQISRALLVVGFCQLIYGSQAPANLEPPILAYGIVLCILAGAGYYLMIFF